MKRKVTLHGPSSLTISLPAKWVNKFHILKGDEVEVTERGRSIIISQKKALTFPKTVIEVADLPNYCRRAVTALYRDGATEIELDYTNQEYIGEIQEILSDQVIGFEIVKQDGKSCLLKDLSGTNDNEFEVALRRSWLLVLSIADDCKSAFQNKDFDVLKSISFRDKSVNKLTNYCSRILVKNGHTDYRKTAVYYFIVRELESIADNYKDMVQGYQKIKKEPTPTSLENFDKVNFYLNELYKMFYDFDRKKAERFISDSRKDFQKIRALTESAVDPHISYFLLSILRKLRYFVSNIIQIYV